MVKVLVVFFVLAMLFVAARWFLPIGPAQALGPATLEVGRQKIVLYGIEVAPEGQMCQGYACSLLARQTLAKLVDDRFLICLPYDWDPPGSSAESAGPERQR